MMMMMLLMMMVSELLNGLLPLAGDVRAARFQSRFHLAMPFPGNVVEGFM
jgi:hypothetical protein